MTHNTTIGNRAQEVLAARLKTITDNVLHLCETTGLPQEIGYKLLEDIADLQQDNFTGLRLSYDDIEALQQYSEPDDWDSIYSEETQYILKEYGQLWQLEKAKNRGEMSAQSITNTEGKQVTIYARNAPYIKAEDGSRIEVRAVALYEFAQRNGFATEDEADGAIIYRHIFATMSLYDFFGIDEADIIGIAPMGICRPELATALQSMNAKNLSELIAHRTHTHPRELPTGKKTKHEAQTDTQAPQPQEINGSAAISLTDATATAMQNRAAVINIMQNTADMLSRSINTADMDENGQAMALRSLRQAINEKEQAGAAIAPQTYIQQALRTLCIIPQIVKPTADGIEYAAYKMTLNELAKACTNTERPNAEQIKNTWQAFNFLSTQRIEFIEYRTPEKKRRYNRKNLQQVTTFEREEDGRKVTYKPYKITTNPVTATFAQELANPEAYSGSTSVVLNVHHIITNGRRMDKIKMSDGTTALIKQPVKHLTTIEQVLNYSSVAGIHFCNLVLSKSHITEEELLNSIFEYEAKINACTSDEEKKKQRRQISTHKYRDRETLQDFFIEAKESGLLAWYRRYESTDKRGKTIAVWEWGRPESEEIKKIK